MGRMCGRGYEPCRPVIRDQHCIASKRTHTCGVRGPNRAGELACKPDPVPAAAGGGHPSWPTVTGRLQRSTRRPRTGRPRTPASPTSSGPEVGLDLAPGGVCRAVPVTRDAGGLLHHRFTLTARPVNAPGPHGGLFSVALSRESLRVAVSNHPALRSPDFPRDSPSRDHPANSPAVLILLAAQMTAVVDQPHRGVAVG